MRPGGLSFPIDLIACPSALTLSLGHGPLWDLINDFKLIASAFLSYLYKLASSLYP